MFKFLSQQALKAAPGPAARSRILSMRLPHTSPPRVSTIARRFSSQNVQKYLDERDLKGTANCEFIGDATAAREKVGTDFDISIPDITHRTLETTVSREFGIRYLAEVSKAKAGRLTPETNGAIIGVDSRAIVPLPVEHGGMCLWVFFILNTGCFTNFLSAEVSAPTCLINDADRF